MQCWQSHTNPQSRWATRDSVTDNLLCKFPRPRLAWLRSQSRLRPCELPFSAVLTSYLFLIREKVIVLFFHLVGDEGLSHDKFSPKIFATPPQSVTFVIRLPALRSADLHCSPPTSLLSQASLIKQVRVLFLNLVGDASHGECRGGTWPRIICFANFRYPASVGDVRHPASGLAQCRLALLTSFL